MKRVLLLLCEGTEIFEAAAFYDVLGWSGSVGSEPVNVTTVGLRSPVTCTFGMRVIPDACLPDIDAASFDALAIPGGFERFGFYEDAYAPDVQSLIAGFAKRDRPIASICVGAFPVAKSGVLNGKRATTYHLMEGRRRRQLAEFDVTVVDEPIVQDGKVITSTSPATAVDVALRLLAQLTGSDNAAKVRHLMGFEAT